jgi:excinuclease UvrABC nuclease subunit
LESAFNEIAGMGSKRVNILLMSFESTESIANADHQLISEKTGIPEKVAKLVIQKAKSFVK